MSGKVEFSAIVQKSFWIWICFKEIQKRVHQTPIVVRSNCQQGSLWQFFTQTNKLLSRDNLLLPLHSWRFVFLHVCFKLTHIGSHCSNSIANILFWWTPCLRLLRRTSVREEVFFCLTIRKCHKYNCDFVNPLAWGKIKSDWWAESARSLCVHAFL